MKLLLITALAVMASADRPGSGSLSGTPRYRYGTPAGTQSQYTSGYGLKSRRTPFQSTLKPLDGGYSSQTNGRASQYNSGAYNSPANGGYSYQNNGDASSQANEGYNSQATYNYQATESTSSQTAGGFYSPSSSVSGARPSAARYTPRYGGSSGPLRAAAAEPTTTPAPPRPYSFSYDVLDVLGNDYGAAEASNGAQVQGQYSVLLPDGRLQTVSYTVDGDSGFVADVQYEGEARFPGADGEERGRAAVSTGAGPDAAAAAHRYGQN